jgi:hypothetical protein
MIIPFLVAHPELAWYVRRLIIRNERHNFGDWIRTEDSLVRDQPGFGDGKLPNSVTNEDFADIIRTVLRDSGLASATEENTWWENIREGIDAPLKLLLLSLAPNIETLVLYLGNTIMTNWPDASFLRFFSKTIHRAALMPVEVRPRICPALAEVRISYSHTHHSCFDYLRLRSYEIAPFFSLPALAGLFVGVHMTFVRDYDPARDYHRGDWQFRLRGSSIKSLYIEAFGEDTRGDFIVMIKGIKALKSFHIKRPEHNFGIYLQALSQSHAGTLEELNLGIYSFFATEITSLVHFRVLKSLTLEVGLLYNILNTRQRKSGIVNWNLDTILPASLEQLQITECQVRHLQPLLGGILHGLANFVGCKATTHSNLRRICLQIIPLGFINDPNFERLRTVCHLHNVLLEGR